MYYKDGRFRKDIFYLLYVVIYYEKKRLLNVVSIYMRMRKSIGFENVLRLKLNIIFFKMMRRRGFFLMMIFL